MVKPLAIYIGFIGKLPLAGMSLANLHVITGLQELGYDVHYVERLNRNDQCYNPISNEMTNDSGFALNYIKDFLSGYGIKRERYSFIDQKNQCHGSGWPALCSALDNAEFVMTMGDPTWFDDLERCSRRAFIDVDPLFTQVDLLSGTDLISNVLSHYNILFTEGLLIGKPNCTVPSADRKWIPTPPVINTKLWNPAPIKRTAPITTVMNWESGSDINFKGHIYGYKNREFARFIELPRNTSRQLTLAVGGDAPRTRLIKYGWQLVNPLKITKTIKTYQQFIAESYADFGIAKHAYVASRCGWFSDRSICYMAAGRPVLHQDTGCGDWLPTGEGVLLFSDMDSVLEALKKLDMDYKHHANKARELAEEYFEATKVLANMLDVAGFN